MPKKNAARTTAEAASGKERRRRRRAPPWGDLLGGKPIERCDFLGDNKLDLGAGFTQEMQYLKMQRLMRYYRIVGPLPAFPIAGFGDVSWWPWYQLALAIASESDESLKIVDAPPRHKTAARWRSDEGAVLVQLVDYLRESRPGRSIRWCLSQFRTTYPFYKRMSLDELVARYYEARRHHCGTKRLSNSARAS
jgi:hypothetical protein